MRVDSPKCPNCGAPVDANAQRCLYCGASIAATSPAPTLSSGIRCPNCSRPNKEDNAFCEFCGAKLLFACPACRNPLPIGRTACPNCGTHVCECFQQRIKGWGQERHYSDALYFAELLRQFDIEGKYTEQIVPLVRSYHTQLSTLYEAQIWTTCRNQTNSALEPWQKPLLLGCRDLIYAVSGTFKKEKAGLFWQTLVPRVAGVLIMYPFVDQVDIAFQTAAKLSREVKYPTSHPMPIISLTSFDQPNSPLGPIRPFGDKLIVSHAKQRYRDVISDMPEGSPQFIYDLLPDVLVQIQLGNIRNLVSPIHPSTKYSGW